MSSRLSARAGNSFRGSPAIRDLRIRVHRPVCPPSLSGRRSQWTLEGLATSAVDADTPHDERACLRGCARHLLGTRCERLPSAQSHVHPAPPSACYWHSAPRRTRVLLRARRSARRGWVELVHHVAGVLPHRHQNGREAMRQPVRGETIGQQRPVSPGEVLIRSLDRRLEASRVAVARAGTVI